MIIPVQPEKLIEIKSNGICKIAGKEYPAVGFGTYPLEENTCFNAVSKALGAVYNSHR